MASITKGERVKVGVAGALLGCIAVAVMYLVTLGGGESPMPVRVAMGALMGLTAVVLASIGGRLVGRALWRR